MADDTKTDDPRKRPLTADDHENDLICAAAALGQFYLAELADLAVNDDSTDEKAGHVRACVSAIHDAKQRKVGLR